MTKQVIRYRTFLSFGKFLRQIFFFVVGLYQWFSTFIACGLLLETLNISGLQHGCKIVDPDGLHRNWEGFFPEVQLKTKRKKVGGIFPRILIEDLKKNKNKKKVFTSISRSFSTTFHVQKRDFFVQCRVAPCLMSRGPRLRTTAYTIACLMLFV